MILTVEDLLLKYANYADARGKIKRDIESGAIYPLVRGIYETDKSVSGMFLASYIYGPSYLSFDYALAHHGMIPEAVYTYSSATFNKRKQKMYSNRFGDFVYRDVPSEVYPFGIKTIEENGYVCLMASAEKALCDKLYAMPPVKSVKTLKEMLFSDLRIDRDAFNSLNLDDVAYIAPKYHSSNLNWLMKLIGRA